MPAQRCLIVNADDFGLSRGINRGIIEAHVRGILTSTSAMTRGRAAGQAAELARAHPRLGVGLHIDLGEWTCRNGRWRAVYEVVPPDDAEAIAVEVRRQLECFRQLFGRDPDHLDSHQHAHRDEPARSELLEMSRQLGVPLRHFSKIKYLGGFYGQDEQGRSFAELIESEALMRILRRAPLGVGELCCHPGFAGRLATTYRRERRLELESLCDPRVRDCIEREGIRLCTFLEVQAAAR